MAIRVLDRLLMVLVNLSHWGLHHLWLVLWLDLVNHLGLLLLHHLRLVLWLLVLLVSLVLHLHLLILLHLHLLLLLHLELMILILCSLLLSLLLLSLLLLSLLLLSLLLLSLQSIPQSHLDVFGARRWSLPVPQMRRARRVIEWGEAVRCWSWTTSDCLLLLLMLS